VLFRSTNFTFNYGLKPIFENVSFTINKNHQVGLVGPNGSGKTTLLKLLLGQEQPDNGRLTVKGTIGWVPQEVTRDPDLEQSVTVRSYLDPHHLHSDHQLQDMIRGVEMPNLSLQQPPSNLSGGQKTKLALLRALLSQPDILLLDEPTNFMDTAGKQWVMNFLSTYPKTLVIISHDLKLLDHSIDKVLYLNIQTHQIDQYTGNYTQFTQLKSERDRLLNRQIQIQSQKIKRMQESLIKMARYTSEKGVRQRTQLKKRLQKVKDNLPDPPLELKKFRLQLPIPANVGSLPVQIKNLTKSFPVRGISPLERGSANLNVKHSNLQGGVFRWLGILVLLGIYIYQVVYYLDSYYVLAPKLTASIGQGYGFKQIVDVVEPYRQQGSKVVVYQSYDQPYIYWLFYEKFDPREYQQIARLEENRYGDVGLVGRIDSQVEFREFSLNAEKHLLGNIYAGPPEKMVIDDWNNVEVLKDIYYPDGNLAFKVVKVIDGNKVVIW